MAGDSLESMSKDARNILAALNKAGGAQAPKAIGEAVGLESKTVSDLIKGLKAQGLVESPVRCKWAITDQGKKSLGG